MSISKERTIQALEKAGIGVDVYTKDGEEREYLICNGLWRVYPDIQQVHNTTTNVRERYDGLKELVKKITGK